MSVNRRMDKQVWYVHKVEYYASWKKDVFDNMDGPGGHYAKWNKPDRKTNTTQPHFHEKSKIVKLKEPERKLVVTRS